MSQASKRRLDRHIAAEAQTETQEAAGSSIFTFRNIALAAGAAIVLPYLVRRLWPMISGDAVNLSAGEIAQAGKDSVRDVADDLNIGGTKGKVERGAGRIADRI